VITDSLPSSGYTGHILLINIRREFTIAGNIGYRSVTIRYYPLSEVHFIQMIVLGFVFAYNFYSFNFRRVVTVGTGGLVY
jgi:hypothetical protein